MNKHNNIKLMELIKKARYYYIHFLKFTNPNCDNYPSNLLELLDSSRDRWIKLMGLEKNKPA